MTTIEAIDFAIRELELNRREHLFGKHKKDLTVAVIRLEQTKTEVQQYLTKIQNMEAEERKLTEKIQALEAKML